VLLRYELDFILLIAIISYYATGNLGGKVVEFLRKKVPTTDIIAGTTNPSGKLVNESTDLEVLLGRKPATVNEA
jgi:hypothetical protein